MSMLIRQRNMGKKNTAKACRTQMTSVPRPDEVPDGSPFGNLEDDHSVDEFSDEDAESVQDGVLDGSPFGNLEDDHSVDGFSDEDAESLQDDEGPPYAMVGQDEISQKEEQEEEKKNCRMKTTRLIKPTTPRVSLANHPGLDTCL